MLYFLYHTNGIGCSGRHQKLVISRHYKPFFVVVQQDKARVSKQNYPTRCVSVPWDKGTPGTKPKEHCHGLPKARSRVQCRNLHLNRLQALPKGRPEVGRTPISMGRSGSGQTWGPSSPHGRCPHTGSPLKSLAQTASEPTPDEGVTRSNRMWPHYYTSLMLHKHDIGRSKSIRHHEVKHVQRDYGHAKLASERDHVPTI
jgi:hypothetical protein